MESHCNSKGGGFMHDESWSGIIGLENFDIIPGLRFSESLLVSAAKAALMPGFWVNFDLDNSRSEPLSRVAQLQKQLMVLLFRRRLQTGFFFFVCCDPFAFALLPPLWLCWRRRAVDNCLPILLVFLVCATPPFCGCCFFLPLTFVVWFLPLPVAGLLAPAFFRLDGVPFVGRCCPSGLLQPTSFFRPSASLGGVSFSPRISVDCFWFCCCSLCAFSSISFDGTILFACVRVSSRL